MELGISLSVHVETTPCPGKVPCSAYDDIYHSSTMHEMLVKADLHGVDVTCIDFLSYMAVTTSYHHAFWPHTSKRFYAFKKLLKHVLPDLRSSSAAVDELHSRIDDRIKMLSASKWRCLTPGGKQELKNLGQLAKILETSPKKAGEA